MRYKTLNKKGEVLEGKGVTLNISSTGILFAPEHDLEVGTPLEVSFSWPFYLGNETFRTHIVAQGRISRRHQRGQLVLKIEKHEFVAKVRAWG